MKRHGVVLGSCVLSLSLIGCGSSGGDGQLAIGPETVDRSSMPDEVRKLEDEKDAIIVKNRADAKARAEKAAAKKAKSAKP